MASEVSAILKTTGWCLHRLLLLCFGRQATEQRPSVQREMEGSLPMRPWKGEATAAATAAAAMAVAVAVAVAVATAAAAAAVPIGDRPPILL